MYQTISEKIDVLGIFRNASFTPKKFKWNHRDYTIDEVTSIHERRDGGRLMSRYAVLSGGNLFLLEHDCGQETWTLEQIWMEG